MKTNELTGSALNWAVVKCHKDNPFRTGRQVWEADENGDYVLFSPSTNWAQGGQIIERENLGVWWDGVWHAKYDGCRTDQVQDAGAPLIAAMRCYVASKLGDEVNVPKDLTI